MTENRMMRILVRIYKEPSQFNNKTLPKVFFFFNRQGVEKNISQKKIQEWQ